MMLGCLIDFNDAWLMINVLGCLIDFRCIMMLGCLIDFNDALGV